MEDVRQLGFGLSDVEAARLAVPACAGKHEDALAVELTVLVRLEAELGECAQPGAKGVREAGVPSPGAWIGPISKDEFELGIRPIDAPELAALPGRQDRAHEVKVCRGHVRAGVP